MTVHLILKYLVPMFSYLLTPIKLWLYSLKYYSILIRAFWDEWIPHLFENNTIVEGYL